MRISLLIMGSSLYPFYRRASPLYCIWALLPALSHPGNADPVSSATSMCCLPLITVPLLFVCFLPACLPPKFGPPPASTPSFCETALKSAFALSPCPFSRFPLLSLIWGSPSRLPTWASCSCSRLSSHPGALLPTSPTLSSDLSFLSVFHLSCHWANDDLSSSASESFPALTTSSPISFLFLTCIFPPFSFLSPHFPSYKSFPPFLT